MPFITGVWLDLRLAVRSLMRNGTFAVLAIAALAIGLGANISAFSAFDAVLARDLPVRNPEELVTFHWLRSNDSMVSGYSGYGRPGPGGTGIRTSFSPVTFERFRGSSQTLSAVIAFADRRRLTVSLDGITEEASGQVVSGNYYAALGVSAFRGRVLSDSDDMTASPAVAVMTYRYWQRRFAGDPTAIGRTVILNGSPVVLVGVTPEGFDGTLATETSDLTLPLAHAGLAEENGRAKPRSTWSLRIMGRLKAGASLAHVEPDLRNLFETSVRESWSMRPPDTPNPQRSGMPTLRAVSGRQGPDGPRRDAMADLAVAIAIGGAILVIGCANVANLVLVRGLKRRREIALRLALGASRRRVVQLLLAESIVLSVAGGALGVILAIWGKHFLTWFPSSSAPIVAPVVDVRVLAFSVALSAATAVLFGLLPALRATRGQLATDIQRRSWRRLPGRAMVLIQVAGCVVMLAAAGLAMRTVHSLNTVDLGFDASNLLVFRLSAPGEIDTRVPPAYDELADALGALPGVTAATFSAMPLIARAVWTETVQPADGSSSHEVHFQIVRSNFFRTIGIRILSGRDFTGSELRGGQPVALINQAMAREVFGSVQSVGRYFRLQTGAPRNVPVEVIGIVDDAKYSAVETAPPPTLYLSASQMPQRAVFFEVRTAGAPTDSVPLVRDTVGRMMPGVAIASIKTQEQQIQETIARPRAFAVASGAFGFVALLLASLGIYGVVSYDVAQRRTELAIRMALGAARSQVLGLVIKDVSIVVALGSVAGVALAASAAAVVQQRLYGVSASDPVTLAAAVIAFAVAALGAALPPAWRAVTSSPLAGLQRD